MASTNQLEIKKFITPEIKNKMTSWEKKFITSLFKREKQWSEKQLEVWNNIKKKYKLEERIVIERIIYLPTGYAAPEHQLIMSKKMRKQIGIYKNTNSKVSNL